VTPAVRISLRNLFIVVRRRRRRRQQRLAQQEGPLLPALTFAVGISSRDVFCCHPH